MTPKVRALPRRRTVRKSRWLRLILFSENREGDAFPYEGELGSHRECGHENRRPELRERLLEDCRYICSGRYGLQRWVTEIVAFPNRSEAMPVITLSKPVIPNGINERK